MENSIANICPYSGNACLCTKILCVPRNLPHRDGSRECQPVKSTNPKRAQGQTKPPLHLVPDAAVVGMAMAFKDGAAKYGPFNWRDDPVDTTTYIAAARRHIALYFNGQRDASDSGVHNLAGAMACLAILLDSEAQGTLIDDRPKAQNLEALMDSFTVERGWGVKDDSFLGKTTTRCHTAVAANAANGTGD